MNVKLIILAVAATCGLAAQTRLTAQIPFPFEFQGKSLAAGSYEITRTSVPDRIVIRNADTGSALASVSAGTDEKRSAKNGLLFLKAGDSYFLQAVEVAATGAAYNIPRSRKHMEAARNRTAQTIYLAAR